MSRFISTLIKTLFLLFVVFYGACISGLVLKEPDICFLLASGRWIVEHGFTLPTTDPFSWTAELVGQDYVIEKWLTEVIFYELFHWTGAAGLLVFDAIILTLTFVVMPYRLLRLNGVTGFPALSITFLATLVSFSHLAVRPEIFSFLFTAIILELLIRMHRHRVAIHWPTLIALTAITALWSNLHTLFLLALMILAWESVCTFAERLLFFKGSERKINWTAPISLITCTLATLINPYGIRLWQYLPVIFGSFNDTNNEMQPLTMATLEKSPLAYPFVLFALIALILLLMKGLRRSAEEGDLFFRSLIIGGIAGGVKAMRSIPVADLFLVAGLARVLGKPSNELLPFGGDKFEFGNPFDAAWISICSIAAGAGAFLMTTIIPPVIPQSSTAFEVPMQAAEFIANSPPRGHMLNDPHFGNVLMWNAKDAPPVFIDSRYNLYGNGLLQDYWTMVLMRPNWDKLMEKYGIDWVFLPPSLPLAKSLASHQDWHLDFQDKAAVVISRKQPVTPLLEK